MKRFYSVFILVSIFMLPKMIMAQGYIDCATILKDDAYYIASGVAAKNIDGYTYLYYSPVHNDPLTAGSLPVINGEDWHTGDNTDAYLMVIDPACNQIFGTYIGGSGSETGDILEIDATGNIIVSGYTDSPDFPTTDGTVLSGTDRNIFIRKYAPDGTLLFSTLYGGAGDDDRHSQLLIDGTDIYLAGYTRSSDFPTTDGTTLSGGTDHFILKLDGNGNLQYATLHGGSGSEDAGTLSISNGQLLLAGSTRSADYPSTDGSTYSGSIEDASLTLFDASGNVLFSTVYGGNSAENSQKKDNHPYSDGTYLYVFGKTTSSDFLTTDGSTSGGGGEIYFRKYDLSGNLIHSKLYGGSSEDLPLSLEFINGSFYLLGQAGTNFPTTDGSTVNGTKDAVIMNLDTDGNINFSTVYGGSGSYEAYSGFYIDASGQIYLQMQASDAPSTDGSSGYGSVFAKFNADGSLCASTTINNGVDGNYNTYYPGVVNDTMYIVTHHYTLEAISTDGSVYSLNGCCDNLSVSKFVFCPSASTGTTSTLTPSTVNVCQNGLIDQIDGEEIMIDGSVFPQIYQGGGPQNQSDIELNYQWQSAISNTGPWIDVPGPLAHQQNFSPPPTTTDLYYRRIARTSECCGGTEADISSVTAILITGDEAPTVDAGGVYYTCPGGSVTIGGSPAATGGTTPYTYNWEDGLYSSPNPSVSPTQSGVYTLEVTDANGCLQVDQATVTIYAANAGADTDVCDGAATLIGGSPLSGVPIVPSGGSSTPGEFNVSYDWSPTAGLSCTDCPNPLASPAATETYTLTVTIHHPDGTTTCNSTDDVTVGVVLPPSGAMTIGEAVLCLGETIELGTNLPPVSEVTIQTVTQTSAPTSNTATVANLTDGDFSTGGHTNDGTTENILIDFGSEQKISEIKLAALSGQTGDDRLFVDLSTDNVNWTTNIAEWSNWNSGISATQLTVISFAAQNVRYVRLRSNNSSKDISISEFYAFLDFAYVWTPGSYITTSGGSAIFDPGNIDMPTPNPITYTVSATLGTCTWYEQVTVAVIEARAHDDSCGPRTIGEEDRTLNINETYTWTMIADPSITTGASSFLGATDQAIISVSASVGGDVGYELTTTFTLPGGATNTCRDTIIVPPTCGGPACEIEVQSDGCPDFSDGETILTAIPENNGDPANWTYSWTSDAGMAGLDNYNSQEVALTDDVTRTYTVTMTSVLDPTYSCQHSELVNDPSFSRPTINVTSPVTTCKGTAISIGDPANNPGLTYEWTNDNFLDNASVSYPEATVNTTTEFIIKATDNVTGCIAEDTVLVIVPTSADAGPDFVVCDNGVVEIGANTDTLGLTYSWAPAGADWRNGTDENDAMPEAFVATTQQFILTATDIAGVCISKDTVVVTVEDIPASFTLPDVDFCPSQGTLVLGNDDGTTGGTSQLPAGYEYSWSGGAVNDGTLENPEVNAPLPTASTTYTVKVSTPGGCNITVEQTFNPLIAAPITASTASVCVGAPHAIGDATNPATVTWTSSPDVNADLSTATGSNPVFTPTSTGTFTFTGTYINGGCTSTAEVTITVQEAIAPALTPLTICEGNTVQIGVANDPTLSYQWDPVTGLDDPYISNPTFSGTTSTNYTLTVVNGNGCAAEASTSVTVNPAPAFAGGIDYPDQEFCDPSTASTVLGGTITPAGTYGYSWSPTAFLDNSNSANPTLFLQGEGTYEYTLEVIDQSTGCSVFKTVTITVGDGCGTGVIGNYVWLDENGDGVQDAGEPGISGVTVELRDGSGNLVATTTTDANGGYIFTGLEDHTYTVSIQSGSLPSGLNPTYDENDGTASPDQSTTVTITDSNEHMTADFGYNFTPPADTDTPAMAATGALGDRIWNDANGDGVQDPGESGIAGVTVTLYSDPDGDGVYDTVAGTTTTDASGNYIFDGLAPAAYVVEVDDASLPATLATTPTGDPDSDGDNTSEPIIVAPGDVVLLGDFGYQPTTGSSIGDLLFVDADGDGIQDAGEPGIPGVTVALQDASGNVIATTTTDENGNYIFPGLPAGTYDVVITDTDNVLGELSPISDPDGGNDLTSNVTVDGTTDDLDQDFGFAPAGHTAGDGMIGNTVYIDADNDGAETAGEGVENVTVELYASDGTTLLATTTTDENGNYLFGGLDASATYVVKVDETTLPGGAVYTNMDDPDAGATSESTVDLSLATNGVDLDQDFGYEATTPVMISGTIWEDTDADGEFALDAATEMTMFEGVTVVLTDANGNIVATTTTDVNGDYSFDNIPADTYTVSVEDVNDVLLGYWHSLGNESEPSTTIVDASGGSVTDVDFGYYIEGASIGNYVWNDTNEDGYQDPTELGIEGVIMTLEIDYNGDGTPEVTLVDTTDANGHYSFDNLLLDEDYAASGGSLVYTISATAPTGYTSTTNDVNGNLDDLEDSDDPNGVIATVVQGSNNTTTNADPNAESPEASYDFGFISTNTTDAKDDINNTAYETPVFGDVSTNDTDEESDTQNSFTLIGANGGMPAGEGTVVLDPMTGTYSYTPAASFSGETSFEYLVCDDGTPIECDTATVFIEVLPPVSITGSPIIANADANLIKTGTTATGNILTNDFDPDDRAIGVTTTLTAATVSGIDENGNVVADAGTLTINSDGTYVFVPTGSFTGVVTQPYTIGTPELPPLEEDNSVLVITVIDDPANTTFANDDAEVTDAGVAVNEDVLVNDSDAESDTQTISSFMMDSDGDGDTETAGTVGVTSTIGGTDTDGNFVANAGDFILNDDGTYTFTPTADFVGNVIVTYTVCDDDMTAQACTEATLVITVLDVNRDYGDAPAAYGDAWHRALTDTDTNDTPDGASNVWLGTQTDFESSQQTSAMADADSFDDAIGFGVGTGDFPNEVIPNTNYDIDIDLNATGTMGVFYGMWIDWDEDGIYEDFYSGFQSVTGLTSTTATINAPSSVGSFVNVRLRVDDDPLSVLDSVGAKTNGEVEDYVAAMALPVELISFDGRVAECNVFLNWATATEENFSHFEVQHSNDGTRFTTIDMVMGHQNTDVVNTYQYVDQPKNRLNYYQLKMVDLDGSVAYSEVLSFVNECSSISNINIFPNPSGPADDYLNLTFYTTEDELANKSNSHIDVYDALGRKIKSISFEQKSKHNSLQVDISQLPSGTYFLHLEGSRGMERFIIQN